MFFIIKEVKIILDFLQGTMRVLSYYFALIYQYKLPKYKNLNVI